MPGPPGAGRVCESALNTPSVQGAPGPGCTLPACGRRHPTFRNPVLKGNSNIHRLEVEVYVAGERIKEGKKNIHIYFFMLIFH